MDVGTPRLHQVEVIRRGLDQVLRGGVRPAWLVQCHELLELDYVRGAAGKDADDPYARAVALERILITAIGNLGDGPLGRTAALLLGTVPDTKGRLLKDRRRLASLELDILPSTFRRNHEAPILDDLAIAIWQLMR